MIFRIFAIICAIAIDAECSRILFVYPTLSKSHIMPLQTLSLELAKKGHQITFMSPYPLDKKISNYREIKIPFNEQDKEFISEAAQNPNGGSMIKMFPKLTALIFRLGNDTLQSRDMRQLMDNEEFDLVVVGFFMTEFMLGLGDHFKCPTILFSPAGSMGIINQAVGTPLGVSGAPHILVPVAKMDFLGRLKTFLATGAELLMTEYMKYRSKQVYDFNFPPAHYRSYEDSLKNVSLALINSHFSNGVVRPSVPNLIEVGGLQVKQKPDPLPEKLKIFMDGAEHGVVFFSLGSNAKSTFLSKETITTILKVFSKLKQRVVMKWESDTMEGQPQNVFIGKWLPQDDILAHPNTKLFISHCGLGGIVEAKFHGVPILGIPLFAEQPQNAANIVRDGWALMLELGSLTEKSFLDSILELINNPKYANVVKKQSSLARDRPLNSQETAVYWVEYVLRYNGAPHLHYQGADLNFWQFNSIDIIFFLFGVVYLTLKVFGFVFRRIFCSKKEKSSKKQKSH